MSEMTMEELLPDSQSGDLQLTQNEAEASAADRTLKSLVEAIIYVAVEPVTIDQIVKAVELGLDGQQARKEVARVVEELRQDYHSDARGIEVREIAGGYKMFTKPEHHDAVRRFVKSLTPPLRLSMAALETLATIAYRQPLTAPEIQAVRGVQGTGVLKTLLDRKLIQTAGRKNVMGKPILYKTTKEFLVQFGLGSLSDLPSMEEFEALIKASIGDVSEPTLPLEENSDGSFSRNPDSIAQADISPLPVAEEAGAENADTEVTQAAAEEDDNAS
jgi:segregation and condensation protein B